MRRALRPTRSTKNTATRVDSTLTAPMMQVFSRDPVEPLPRELNSTGA